MPDRPNIVLIHTHDTGRHLGCYGAPVPTPHLSRLAREGALFRRAFCASPSCSASRAAMMTGQMPHTNGVIGLVHRGFRMLEVKRHLSHLLREAGYRTALGLPVGERPKEMLFDLAGDPQEFENVADSPHYADALADLRRRLDGWMAATDDPIRHGPIPPPGGAKVTPHDAVSP